MVHQDETATRFEDTSHLADNAGIIRNAAQGVRAHHGVEAFVGKGQVLSVCLEQAYGTTRRSSALSSQGQHFGAQVESGQPQASRIVGKIEPSTNGYLEREANRP
jgi:hypothetical protein